MSEAISPQRLAEIRENDRLDRQRGSLTASMVADIADHRTELLAEVDRLRRELAWHRPEAINTAVGAPHRVRLSADGWFTIRHNIGCNRNGGRREARTGELICHIESYLDQTDEDERPGPGDYWVIVDVFGRSEEPVDALWLTDNAARVAELEGEREGRRADLTDPGDWAVGYEWATRTPDGTRTRWTKESEARAFWRRHPDVRLDWRQIRHFVGAWREADPAAPDRSGGSEQ